MILGIDASNLRSGGGVTHLVELLRAAQPRKHGFNQVIVWGSSSILQFLEERSWLKNFHEPLLDQFLPMRFYWQSLILNKLLQRAACDILLVPGGLNHGRFQPFVTMSRNLLPFEKKEALRYGISWKLLRLALLRQSQTHTFQRASGLIFLTQYARQVILPVIEKIDGADVIIPHGINKKFMMEPRTQREINACSTQNPLRILYVSIIDPYKHQGNVVEAIAALKKEGYPVNLDLIGPAYPPAFKRLKRELHRLDPKEEFIHYKGPVKYDELSSYYHRADLFVFASSCENMPNILLEAMASGLPIACSNRGPMPEVLGDAGVYFDPENPKDIARSVRELLESPSLRAQKAAAAFERAKTYSWERCADETFGFLARIVAEFKQNHQKAI
jgi:glycosyltransferase involved in cell wall biosynthesis